MGYKTPATWYRGNPDEISSARRLGNDTIFGGDDNDVLIGGVGNDFLNGRNGDDQLFGGDGDDYILGKAGNDQIDAGNGNDEIRSGSGDDFIDAGAGDDIVNAGSGDDTILGGTGDDDLLAGAGADIIVGGDGYDWLDAGSGRDILIGGQQSDLLQGRGGDDLLVGGTTSFDSNAIALDLIWQEWNSDRSYADRILNLSGQGTEDRANGSIFLIAEEGGTVFDDEEIDVMFGNRGMDWFFANDEDLDDQRLNEILANDLDDLL